MYTKFQYIAYFAIASTKLEILCTLWLCQNFNFFCSSIQEKPQIFIFWILFVILLALNMKFYFTNHIKLFSLNLRKSIWQWIILNKIVMFLFVIMRKKIQEFCWELKLFFSYFRNLLFAFFNSYFAENIAVLWKILTHSLHSHGISIELNRLLNQERIFHRFNRNQNNTLICALYSSIEWNCDSSKK